MWNEGLKRLKKNKAAVFSFWLLLGVSIISMFAYQLAPYSFEVQYNDRLNLPPNALHWLGTDSLGRDMFSRIIYGGRMSMAVGVFTALASLIIGGIYGAVSGWCGGEIDAALMRVVDIMFALPELVLVILVNVLFQSFRLFENPEVNAFVGTFLALSVVGWVNIARLVRGQVLQVKEMVYVDAAKVMGASSFSIVAKHIVPNILGPVIVVLTYQVPANVLFESFLSFIGLGLKPPFASWGVLCAEGWKAMRVYPHMIFFPSLALSVTMLAFNWFGDGLRDAFDPQMKNRA